MNADICLKSEQYVHFLCRSSTPRTLSASEISQATSSDETLQIVINCLDKGNWHLYSKCEDVMRFCKIADQLTYITSMGVLLKGKKMVIPLSLRNFNSERSVTSFQAQLQCLSGKP